MTRGALLAGVLLLAGGSTLVLAQERPEDLLPPGFDEPTSAPTPLRPARPTAAPPPAPPIERPPTPGGPAMRPGEVVQALPTTGARVGSGVSASQDTGIDGIDVNRLPTLSQLEAMSTDELDELFGLKPKVDIPIAAQRGLARVGVLDPAEGGLPVYSLAQQPASLVRAALAGTRGAVVSRWGHILLRRALVSRLAAPAGMDPAEFAALRAGLLGRMGEFAAARALVQDVDTANYTPALTDAAFAAYLGTADILGACPAVRLAQTARKDAEWRMTAAICAAYSGEATNANRDLRRIMARGDAARIDALLAQRLAGAAGTGRRAVTIEWDGVAELTPWRFALANAVGAPLPDSLTADSAPYYAMAGATAPMLTAAQRAIWADDAARRGVLSAAAISDLYAEILADGEDGPLLERARTLRSAYLGGLRPERLAAIKTVWGNDTAEPGGDPYGRWVLTAGAAARLAPDDDILADAGPLIASMLAAGYDRDAARWSDIVPNGSLGWALIALSRSGAQQVSGGAVGDFLGDDASPDRRKSKMLIAGLAALGRTSDGAVEEYSDELAIDLRRRSRWTQAITAAGATRNQALVALLAGLGMQGDSWDQMTALHLFHIVRALDQVGLRAEARMIAAEAVARA